MNCLRLLRFAERQTLDKLKILSLRNITNHPSKFTEIEDRWRERDGVSKRWRLIYKGPMDKALNYLTLYLTFSTTTATLGGLYYAAFEFDKSNMNNPVILGDDVVIANSPLECLVYVGSFIALHITLTIFVSRYVLRMYQDGDKYLAVFRGSFFNSIKKHEFHLKSFRRLKSSFFVTWSDARFDLGNQHAIILERYFKTPECFNNLLKKRSADDQGTED